MQLKKRCEKNSVLSGHCAYCKYKRGCVCEIYVGCKAGHFMLALAEASHFLTGISKNT